MTVDKLVYTLEKFIEAKVSVMTTKAHHGKYKTELVERLAETRTLLSDGIYNLMEDLP